MLNLAKLHKGQKAVIRSFTNDRLGARLIDLGFLPGEEVLLSMTAPLGCPFAVQVAGNQVSLRRDEAATILVDPII